MTWHALDQPPSCVGTTIVDCIKMCYKSQIVSGRDVVAHCCACDAMRWPINRSPTHAWLHNNAATMHTNGVLLPQISRASLHTNTRNAAGVTTKLGKRSGVGGALARLPTNTSALWKRERTPLATYIWSLACVGTIKTTFLEEKIFVYGPFWLYMKTAYD